LNIYEYQAKKLFRDFGVPTPKGEVVTDAASARQVASEIGGDGWVVKAQILAGGRGKAGGIGIAGSLDEVQEHAQRILSTPLATHQSGGEAKKVGQVLVEEKCDIGRELYLAITVDRVTARPVVIASSEGGVEIEETAKNNPTAIFKTTFDPVAGMMPYEARNIAAKLGIKEKGTVRQATHLLHRLSDLFVECDCSLAEINPLVITGNGDVVALDAKLGFDDSALGRHAEIAALRSDEDESPREKKARENDLSYIGLDGSIGCMVNGAGLAMATMDSVKVYGGEPANFLDVGGDASTERVREAFKILISDENVRVILINIFGGILQCDRLAEGIVAACEDVNPSVPLVVRLEGTNVERGREILAKSGLNIITEPSMQAAAERAVELAGN
jgi:succinyl-CoA synthetase beta subunit